jgi:amylosucrase
VSGAGHRGFLAEYYRGDFPGSPARGVPFATNEQTGDERTSGMTAALVGVTAAVAADDAEAIDQALARAALLYGIAFGHGGVPVIYMGDELAQGNDIDALDDPERAADSRWVHRPAFDDDAGAQVVDAGTVPGRMWAAMRHLVDARRSCGPLHGGASTRYVDVGAEQVFCWHRHHPRFGDLIGLANVGSTPVVVDRAVLDAAGLDTTASVDALHAGATNWGDLAPYQVRWLVDPDSYPTVPAPPTASAAGGA